MWFESCAKRAQHSWGSSNMVTHLENWSRLEFQGVIRCLWERRVSAADIHRLPMKVYGNGVIPRQQFVMQCHKFTSGRGQCDRRQVEWITKLLAARSQHCKCLGPHWHGQTCNFVANGIWPCFIQQQYAAYRSGCVRLLPHRTLLALRLQCNDIRYTRHYMSRTVAAINSRRHALLQYEHVMNCNSDDIWVNMTVSLHYIFKSSAEYSAINCLTWFI